MINDQVDGRRHTDCIVRMFSVHGAKTICTGTYCEEVSAGNGGQPDLEAYVSIGRPLRHKVLETMTEGGLMTPCHMVPRDGRGFLHVTCVQSPTTLKLANARAARDGPHDSLIRLALSQDLVCSPRADLCDNFHRTHRGPVVSHRHE